MTINPAFFGGLEEFKARTESMIDELKAGKKVRGTEKIFYPGEIEFAREDDAAANGVELSEASVMELKRACTLAGCDPEKLDEIIVK